MGNLPKDGIPQEECKDVDVLVNDRASEFSLTARRTRLDISPPDILVDETGFVGVVGDLACSNEPFTTI